MYRLVAFLSSILSLISHDILLPLLAIFFDFKLVNYKLLALLLTNKFNQFVTKKIIILHFFTTLKY